MSESEKKPIRWSAAWEQARGLIWARRGRLAFGLGLMLVNRLAGLVLPYLSKSLVDDVGLDGRVEMLSQLAWVAGGAALVQAVSSFG